MTLFGMGSTMTKRDVQPDHEIILSVGRTGSGKTRIIKNVFGPRHPRRITLDAVGEAESLYPDAYVSVGIRDVLTTLSAYAEDRSPEWHLIAILSEEESAQLVSELVPVYQPGVVSLSRAFGGVCVEHSEIDTALPVSGSRGAISRAWTTAFARGRHVKCSFLCATQRPHQVARIVSSQASRVVSFAMHEPRDLRWIRDAGTNALADLVSSLGRWESAHYDAREGVIERWNRDYQRVSRVSLIRSQGSLDI